MSPPPRMFAPLVLLLHSFGASAAPAAPDPLLDRLIADARALAPATMSFDRTTNVQATSNAESGTRHRVDHWSGKAWTLVSVEGKPPSADDLAKYAKAPGATNVPGYYRLGVFLPGATRKAPDAAGRTVYHLDHLPPGSIVIGGDVSDKVSADATVDTGGIPYVTQLHVYSREPFRVMLVARVDSLDTVNDYVRGGDGKPVMVRSVNTLSGSQFGTAGTQRSEVVITNVRPTRP